LRVLAIDTALGACSACILESGAQEPEARESLLMERGHAEALMPLIDRVVSACDGRVLAHRPRRRHDRPRQLHRPARRDLGRPGDRARRRNSRRRRHHALRSARPLVAAGDRRLLAAAIDARHGAVYFQAVAPGGRSVVAPSHITVREAVRFLGSGPVVLTGSAAALVATEAVQAGVLVSLGEAELAPDVAWVARLGMAADPGSALPKPLYLRAPDAPPAGRGADREALTASRRK
jgi:tRNA threonylcarbamoyladenosine biosynthesis protein TsaB